MLPIRMVNWQLMTGKFRFTASTPGEEEGITRTGHLKIFPMIFCLTGVLQAMKHLDNFDLINMNGRVYDPWVSRFLSPDPFVQSPTYSQSYNRYAYAFNNPLKFVDLSGYSNRPPVDYRGRNGSQGFRGEPFGIGSRRCSHF